jgi:uncharacterized phosphosugar-binding protein
MSDPISVESYSKVAIAHLQNIASANRAAMERISARLVEDVKQGRSLFVFGSGHSAIFPMELYHRAGGASFVIPVVADYLLPIAGPPVVRILERTPGSATPILARAEMKPGEMVWLSSQSGINGAVVDAAIEAKKRGLYTVAFTSKVHSSAVKSRHPSGQRLFEVCDETIDLGGFVGDASVKLSEQVMAGPLSTLGSVLLGHSIVVAACATLEAAGVRCVYASVNTPEGESRNRALEEKSKVRDPLLRD